MLMSQPLIAGADGMNATEQLYGLVGDDELFDIIGEIAVDPDANIWDDERVQNRLEELGVYMVTPAEPAQADQTPPVAEGRPEDLPGIDYDRPGDVKRRQPSGDDDHNPYPYSKEEDDDYFREIFRKKREAKDQGVAESDTPAQPAVQVINDFDEVVAEFDTVPKGFRDNLRSSEFDAVQWLADVMKNDPDFDITTIEKIVLRPGVFGPDEHVIDVTEYLDHLDEADNMSTFEQAQCNQTMEGEYCPEHGLAECGNYGMYESELARIKSLAQLR
jgi:hypothetical protein